MTLRSKELWWGCYANTGEGLGLRPSVRPVGDLWWLAPGMRELNNSRQLSYIFQRSYKMVAYHWLVSLRRRLQSVIEDPTVFPSFSLRSPQGDSYGVNHSIQLQFDYV